MELKKIKELITVGSGDLIGTSLSAGFWFFLASQIEPSEYGELQWFIALAGILSSVALVGNVSTITVYASKNIPIQSTLNFISLLASAILALVVIIIFPAFNIIDSGILLIAYVINSLAVGDLLGRKKFQEYSKYTIVQKGLTLGLGFLFYYLFGYEAIIFALVITYVLHYRRVIVIFKEMRLNLQLIKDRKGFIINNYFSSSLLLGAIGTGHIDKIIITPILGFTLLGNYSLALQIIGVMMMFTTIFYKYVLTQDSSNINVKNLKILAVIISIIMAVVGITLGPILIDTYFPKYVDTKIAIQIMSINVIPATIGQIFQSKLLGTEKSKPVLIGTILAISALTISMIILGLTLGMIGLAYSLLISSIIKTVYFGYVSRNNIQVRNQSKRENK